MELEQLFFTLGLNRTNGLFITKENRWKKETHFPNRVKRLIERKINPDAFFCFDNKPLLLFFNNPGNKNELHRLIWNFNECPIVIILDKHSIEIFNGFNYLKEEGRLEKIGNEDKLSLFTYFELVTGNTWEQYHEQLNYKNRVDYHLLNNIKSARELLVSNFQLPSKIANAIIGKCIFVRYLIDRKVKMRFDGKLRVWTNDEFCDLLNNPKKAKQFFDYLEDNEDGFNGDLFPISDNEYLKIEKQHFEVLRTLLKGDNIKHGQLSLFQLYDFSIIPIEFISNVYELFIGENNQKAEGAYYTPLFLVDYILKETIDKKLSVDKTSFSCRVLDPACGSGIFLVETLRKIIEKYILQSGIDVKSEKFKTAIRNLAKDNIYGIDKDLSAVQVAVFSIYLTLLDYLEPPGIETFKFPRLLNSNFFHADFFDEKASFNLDLAAVEFDFIAGNPPWKGSSINNAGTTYLSSRRSRERDLGKKFPTRINNNEIAEGFVLRVSDFCSEQTKVSLIIRSSILYNLGYNDEYNPFRQYWLEEFFIDKVFELGPVRFEVFEKSNQPAVAPAVIVFYRFADGKPTDDNVVEHISLKESRFFSLFKIFTINKADYKIVEQKKLKEFDWLWKVLVYGSYLDFNFIKRLKEEFPSVKKIISDENKVIEGTGIQYSSNPDYDSRHLIGQPFIDTYGVNPFFINPDKIFEFDKTKVHRLRDERLFKAPMLLVREGINMDGLTAKCVISDKDILFKDSITSIKVIQKSDVDLLYNIAAVFSSSIFVYYAICVFASIGIERERVKNYNKYSLPYLDLNVMPDIKRIEGLYQNLHFESKKILIDDALVKTLQENIRKEFLRIENIIFKKLNLNNIETSLISYALEVNRTLIVGDEQEKQELFQKISFEAPMLNEYASLFIERFKSKVDTEEKNFVVEVWYTSQLVGMFFKTVSRSEYSKDIVWLDKQNEDIEILALLAKMSSEKLTDKLFVQKDIRGFEKEYFYIFKPNEKRLWHKAVGYLDVYEFADAILKAGRSNKDV